MSLKVVHVFVIILSTVLLAFFGFWALCDYTASRNSVNLVWGILSLLGGIALVPYLYWFISKMKKVRP